MGNVFDGTLDNRNLYVGIGIRRFSSLAAGRLLGRMEAGNKGSEAAERPIEMANVMREIA